MDPRDTKLAELIVNYSMEVKKGDKVVISVSDFATVDLMRECMRLILEKRAFPYIDVMGANLLLDRVSKGDIVTTFYKHANNEQLKNIPSIFDEIIKWGDKFIRIVSYDNYSHTAGVDRAKIQVREKAVWTWIEKMLKRTWVLTYYPTEAMAQKSGMSTDDMRDFYFNSVFVDYKKMQKNGEKLEKMIDDADEIRIVGEKTDLTMSVKGRLAENACGRVNLPDGEVFCAPIKNSVNGTIYFDLPNSRSGVDVIGALLEVKNGKVITASAEQGEEILLSALATDAGSKYFGELGLGLNYGIDRPMRNTLFDEKIGGTIHMALGSSYTTKRGGAVTGGNKAGIHWDMVKDMRKKGSEIYLDGKLRFKNGKWLG